MIVYKGNRVKRKRSEATRAVLPPPLWGRAGVGGG